MSRLLHVVGVQARSVEGDPEATVDRFEREVRTLRSSFPEAQLYLFPELWLTGEHPFRHSTPERELAVTVPGPLTERLGKVAERAERWICAGSIYERGRAGAFYNTALVFSPDGELVTTYRKLYPWMPFERSRPGTKAAPVFDIPDVGRLGVMICYDGWFPEVARGLALQGAELIAQPTATTTPDREEEIVLARANAIANQVYLFNPNMVSTFGPGRSVGVDPEGRVLFEAGAGEELFVEVVDLDRVDELRRRGTRGITRPWRHFREGPLDAVLEPYDEARRRAT
jgi:formamidase